MSLKIQEEGGGSGTVVVVAELRRTGRGTTRFTSQPEKGIMVLVAEKIGYIPPCLVPGSGNICPSCDGLLVHVMDGKVTDI